MRCRRAETSAGGISTRSSPAAEHDDLPSALQRLAHELKARIGIAVTCSIAADLPSVLAEARETIWYVAREALTNAERHAAASLTLALECQRDGWLLRVVDQHRLGWLMPHIPSS